ncbi:hypothetical protein EON09_04650 [Pseudomonas soli]|nr:hypothetical protein [Pseudomonas soli]NBK37816.1 hypothetical protein [Pseudomonas soli]PYC44530.1 hypothetical protein DMX05_08660 [Pseudomonas soli]
MTTPPTDLDVAMEIGISETEVKRYRGDTFLLGDGAWLVHFGYTMPKELRSRLTGSFTLIFKPHMSLSDRRRPG